jgi:large subunit ribosomal protein L4e
MALRAALAASAIPALVMARGHNIEDVPEIPLVVPTKSIESLQKTKDAFKLLVQMGLAKDLLRAKTSRHLRPGKGKMRNRRYKNKKGPLIVVNNRRFAHRSFRSLLGVDVLHVQHLNLLKLCPGGFVGRMIVWSEDAFKKLPKLFPMHPGHVVDSKRVINSEEVQGVLRRKRRATMKESCRKPRPRLNPAAPINRKKARVERKKAQERNKNLKTLFAYKKAKVLKKKQWILKVKGLMTKKGVPIAAKIAEMKAKKESKRKAEKSSKK